VSSCDTTHIKMCNNVKPGLQSAIFTADMMRTAFIFFITGLMLSASGQTKKIKTCVRFTYTQPYCGGARPTKEVQEQSQVKRNYALKTIIAVSANGVDSARTGKSGIWSKKLRPGTYTFYEAWQYYRKGIDGKDASLFMQDCLAEEWKRGLFTLEVKKAVKQPVEATTIHRRCDHQLPCLINQPAVPE
jgi:hypothetical protein